MSVPYSAPDLPVCTVADSDKLVSVTNTTSSAITVVGIAADETMTALADVGAGETMQVVAPTGTETLGFMQNDDWLGDGYSVTEAIDQSVSVPFAEAAEEATDAAPIDPLLQAMIDYQTGDGSVPVRFTNTTPDTITVVAADENNNGYALYNVEANAVATERAQPGTLLYFYKAGTNEVVGGTYTVEISDGENVSIPVAKTKAAPALSAMQQKQRGPGSIEVMFSNGTAENVTVVVADEQEKGHALFDMGPGEFFPMLVLPGAKLFFFKKGTAEPVAPSYEVAGTEGERVAITPPEEGPKLSEMQQLQQGDGSVEAEFTNTLAETATVIVLAEGKGHVLFDIAAGETAMHRVLPAADLRFINKETSAEVGAPYVVVGLGGEAISIVPAKPGADPENVAMRDKHSGPGSVDIEFTNLIDAEIAVTVDDAGTAATLYTIPTGQIVTQKALPGTELWFFNTKTKTAVPPSYTVTDAPQQAVNIPARPTLEQVKQEQSGPGSVLQVFVNTADVPLEGIIRDSAGLQVRLFKAEPYSASQVQMLPNTEVWFVRADTDEIVSESYLVPDKVASVMLPYAPLNALAAAEAGPGSVPVDFINSSTEAVAVTKSVLGVQQTLFYIQPKQHIRHLLQPKSPIWFFKGKTEEASGRDLPFFVRGVTNERVMLPFNPTDDELIAMNEINIDKIIADFTKQAAEGEDKGPKFCWRDSYGRGVGTVPRNCPPGMSEDTAGLCYTDCKAGYYPAVTMCIPECPPGYRNDGLYCFKPAPYERAAFPWEFGDGLNLDGAFARCAASAEGQKYGCGAYNANTIVYSHCPSGYETAPVITSLCSPVCPSGMIDIGISCQKITYDRGVGQLMSCSADKQYDAGLCYDNCTPGFAGVGPVCWNQCPASLPYGCGAGCAKDKSACDWAIADQVTSPLIAAGSIALTVLTAGGSTGATAGAKAGASVGTTAAKTGAQIAGKAALKEGAKAALKAGVKAALKNLAKGVGWTIAKEVAFDQAVGTGIALAIYGGTAIAAEVNLAKLKEAVKAKVREQMIAEVPEERIDAIVNTMMEGAEQKGGADIEFSWSSLDPTGIADIVIAYNHPICTDVK